MMTLFDPTPPRIKARICHMNNALVTFDRRNVSKLFGTDAPTQNNLSSGIAASYGFMRYKGKMWSLSYRGEDMPLLRDDGDGPRNSIEVVILNASPGISKTFYIDPYSEGNNAPPDCASINGVVPNPASPRKQSETCAACPQNVWGSRVTPAGKSAKACQDNKRLVIVPLQDIPNESYGGPLLLRVPPTSLQDLAQYGDKMFQQGYASYMYGTKISFDLESPHPKFKFEPIRLLDDDEAAQVLRTKDLPVINRILNDTSEVGAGTVSGAPSEGVDPAWNDKPKENQSQTSTGATSAQSAPHADTTTAAPQTPTTPTASPQGSASPQPTPTTQPTQPTAQTQTSTQPTPKPAGFATTANTGQRNGSGFGAPSKDAPNAAQEATSQTQEDKPQINTSPEDRSPPEEVAAKFEKGLDDMMSKLLPK